MFNKILLGYDGSPHARTATAYGIFNTAYGLSWFLGSALLGLLYDISITYLVAFSVVTQVLSIPLILYSGRKA